jgi:hypothetical protein
MKKKKKEIKFFVVLGLELRAYNLSHSTRPFVMDVFKIESSKLFARAGMKPLSS